ncbi:MAG: endonuclease III [Candidatus Krumholzibacteriota bacterium]|nr:endonuclease III [Candidatus Krumholzibacteriota bacterium]
MIVPFRRSVKGERDPSVSIIARETRSPFRVLVSTVISARTKDEVTGKASERLFGLAATPEDMARLEVQLIEKAIYPAGFYKTKAVAIRDLASMIISRFGGSVPDNIDDLVTLPGVGRKTANLVVTLGFGKPGICVDTHVHKVCNRLGVLRTRNPEETEYALRKVLDRKHWIEINDLLVMYGKKVCTSVSPWCSLCPVNDRCDKTGVTRSR